MGGSSSLSDSADLPSRQAVRARSRAWRAAAGSAGVGGPDPQPIGSDRAITATARRATGKALPRFLISTSLVPVRLWEIQSSLFDAQSGRLLQCRRPPLIAASGPPRTRFGLRNRFPAQGPVGLAVVIVVAPGRFPLERSRDRHPVRPHADHARDRATRSHDSLSHHASKSCLAADCLSAATAWRIPRGEVCTDQVGGRGLRSRPAGGFREKRRGLGRRDSWGEPVNDSLGAEVTAWPA